MTQSILFLILFISAIVATSVAVFRVCSTNATRVAVIVTNVAAITSAICYTMKF